MFSTLLAQRQLFLAEISATEQSIQRLQRSLIPITVSQDAQSIQQQLEQAEDRYRDEKITLGEWAGQHEEDLPRLQSSEWQEFCSAYQSSPLFEEKVTSKWEAFAPLWQKYIHLTNDELELIFTLAAKYKMSFQWVELELRFCSRQMIPSMITDVQQIACIPSLGLSLRCETITDGSSESFDVDYGGSTVLILPLYRRAVPAHRVLQQLLLGRYPPYLPNNQWDEVLSQGLLDREECEIRSLVLTTQHLGTTHDITRWKEYRDNMKQLKSYLPEKVLSAIQPLIRLWDLDLLSKHWFQQIRIVEGRLELPEAHL